MAQTPGASRFRPPANQMVKLKCDLHSWMSAWVWVQDNPLFAVTGEDGSFIIKNVPFGIWNIEVWHERFETLTAQVLVLPWTKARVAFRYPAGRR
jgi:hypothetical protein